MFSGMSGSIQVVRPFSSVTAVAMEAVHLNVIANLIEETDDDIFEEIDNIRFMRFFRVDPNIKQNLLA